MKRSSCSLIGALLLLVMLISGCAAPSGETQHAAETLAARYEQTVTVVAMANEQPHATLEALKAQATATVASFNVQRTLEVANNHSAAVATQAVEAPILAELPVYGADTSRGRVAWTQSQVLLRAEGYNQVEYANEYSLITAKNFVMAADVTWDTQYGASGCGFTVRANGSAETPSAYMIAMSRGRTGYIYFLSQINGDLSNFASIFANGIDERFDWQKDSTNRLAVVGNGNQLAVYTNYTHVGLIDVTAEPVRPNLPPLPVPPARPNIGPDHPDYDRQMEQYHLDLRRYEEEQVDYQQVAANIRQAFDVVLMNYNREDYLEEGFVGFLAFAQSGYADCKFENAWLWQISD